MFEIGLKFPNDGVKLFWVVFLHALGPQILEEMYIWLRTEGRRINQQFLKCVNRYLASINYF